MITDASTRWIFEHTEGDGWRWTLVTASRGSIQSPSKHPTIAAAITEAMSNGFSSKTHYWIVDDHTYTTHYKPGKSPETISKADATKRSN